MALQAMIDALDGGQRVAVLVPTLELVRQWAREIAIHVQPRFGGKLQVRTLGGGGVGDLGAAHVLVATSSSAARYRLLPAGQAGLLIADECHHYGAEVWSEALEPGFEARLGLTATYSRDDSGLEAYLDSYFGGVSYRVGYEEALTDGVIAPFRKPPRAHPSACKRLPSVLFPTVSSPVTGVPRDHVE
jgi:RNA polymerase primary sigma factor